MDPVPLEPYALPQVFEQLVLSNYMSTLLIKLLAEDKSIRYDTSLSLRADLKSIEQSIHETPGLLLEALEFKPSEKNLTAPDTLIDFRDYRLINFALEYLYKYIYESNIQYLSIFGGKMPIAGLKNDKIEELNLEN